MSKGRNPITAFAFKAMRGLNRVLSRTLKLKLIREAQLYPWQIEHAPDRAFVADTVPAGAREYLRPDNPRLLELTEAYAKFDNRVTTPAVWVEGNLTDSDLLYFRGQNPFVWQIGHQCEDFRYALSYYALKSGPAGDLLSNLDEDTLFGVFAFEVDGRPISRDLLDSVREIDFIRTHVGLDEPETNILDIGAGYGRLVHRLKQVTGNNVHAFATDAFPGSTFISEYYLRFRGVKNATVVPLTEVEGLLAERPIKLAINIHSFSECTLDAIDWWVSRLAKSGVPNLLVIPNQPDVRSGACLTNEGEDMEAVFARHGYRLHVREPRFLDATVQSYGIDPAHLSLFRLEE